MPDESSAHCQCSGSKASHIQQDVREPIASHVSVFCVPLMDCPSEESLIRAAVSGLDGPITLTVDIPNRTVRIYHCDMAADIERVMRSLRLGASLVSLELVDIEAAAQIVDAAKSGEAREAWTLRWLMAINAVMFALELGVGIAAQSTGLIADSLDMFADAAVYGVSLYAVGKAAKLKRRAAHFSGGLQLMLALGLLFEVLRRAVYGNEPVSMLMMSMGSIALVANVACLLFIYKLRNQGAHMKASWIFSANDVLANAGVIVAGTLVAITGSEIPDLVIGSMIGVVVLIGARRILMLG